PPRRTPFPYTTLFRSRRAICPATYATTYSGYSSGYWSTVSPSTWNVIGGAGRYQIRTVWSSVGIGSKLIVQANDAPGPVRGSLRDRKSTRLNSSHVKI